MEGYTKISNKYLDWITSQPHLTGLDLKIVFFIFRKTISWNKLSDKISLTQFQKLTQFSRQGIINSLNKLEKRKIIMVLRYGKGRISHYKLVNCGCKTSQPEFTSVHAQTSQPRFTYKTKEHIQKDFIISSKGLKLDPITGLVQKI